MSATRSQWLSRSRWRRPRMRARRSRSTTRCCPRAPTPAKAQDPGAPLIHDVAPNNTIYQWHLGDQKATEAAFNAANHVTRLDIVNNRLVPNAIEPRAALADY